MATSHLPTARAGTTGWTVATWQSLPDDGHRYEIVDGELFVTPAPSWRHQRAARELLLRLAPYVRAYALGDLQIAPSDVVFDERTVIEPDVYLVPLAGDGRLPRAWKDVGRMLLAVEILSPSTARADRDVKRRLYQRQRVPEFWIVDLDARLVERWRPADERPEILTGALAWQPSPTHPSLTIDLPRFFADTLGE